MWLIAWRMLGDFAHIHPDALAALKEWKVIVEKATWSSFSDIRKDINSVDQVGDRYVFNIGGNKYRLICGISFTGKIVFTKWIGTHGEYDRIKNRIEEIR